jgi:hypothetical protein
MNTKTYVEALIYIYAHPNRIKMDHGNANLILVLFILHSIESLKMNRM